MANDSDVQLPVWARITCAVGPIIVLGTVALLIALALWAGALTGVQSVWASGCLGSVAWALVWHAGRVTLGSTSPT